MPSTGAPAAISASLICGEPASPTDSGPPERMMPFGANAAICFGRRVVRQDLAVDADLAHAARDQLRVLAAEVDDENALGVAGILGSARALAVFVIPRSGSSAVLW